MGIKSLMTLIMKKGQRAVEEINIEELKGCTVAFDATMTMYQFLISTTGIGKDGKLRVLGTKKDGESENDGNEERTGHLIGLLHRTNKLLSLGIKPIWVFDGKPPDMKNYELNKRKAKKEYATEVYKQAVSDKDVELQYKMNNRLVRVSDQQKNDAIKMLTLMGIPTVQAPSEAEAQCTELSKKDKTVGVGSEDLDCLAFGAKVVFRSMNLSKSDKISKINLEVLLKELNLNYDQFVDVCILCGCDYTDSIPGIGPMKSYDLIQKYKQIENIVENLSSILPKKSQNDEAL